jgi:hypothetical protein
LARRGYGRQVLVLSLIILALGALVAALLNPRLASGERRMLRACIVPVQTVKLEPLGHNDSLTSFSILYYRCPGGICSHNISEARIPPEGGEVSLGPSVLQNILAYAGNTPLPASVIEASQPGVLRAVWGYPSLKAGAMVAVEADEALLLIGRNLSNSVKLVEVGGCQVENVTETAAYTVYRLKCARNVAAEATVHAELVEDRLHGLLLSLKPANALTCRAYAQPVLYLKLPFLLASASLLAAAAAILYRQS